MDENIKKELLKLLDYQKKDVELRRIYLVIDRDTALAEKDRQKKTFNDAKQTLNDCEQQAGGIISAYAELKKIVDDIDAAFAELEGSEAESEEELIDRVKKLETLKSKIPPADKKAHDVNERSKEICRIRSEALKAGKNAQQMYNDAKKKHDDLVNSKSAEINRIKGELDALRGGLDPKFFAEYEKLSNDGKIPPVVPAAGDDKKGMFNCGGCGLDLSQQSNTKLKSDGWCNCDNCHRIIVKFK